MVGVVSGSDLGLNTSSLSLLGGGGTIGSSAGGRGGENVFVNAATGNLIIRRTDDFLLNAGADIALINTYNSQGVLSFDNNDTWQFSGHKRVMDLTGKLNTVGSTITRVDGDGSEQLYSYDVVSSRYVSTEGEGAYDSLEFAPTGATGNWLWHNGVNVVTETYRDVGVDNGRIFRRSDPDGNLTRYIYDKVGLLTQIRNDSGDQLTLEYTGTDVTSISTQTDNGDGTFSNSTFVRYTYDKGVLVGIITDLTPHDRDVADSNVYITKFKYNTDGLVSAIGQVDGTTLAFTYLKIGGDWRVATTTDALSRVTQFDYDTVTNTTTVTDPLGNQTQMVYDLDGQLLQIIGPAVGGSSQQVTYTYNANGDVTSVTDAEGNQTIFEYDGDGNLVRERDALGNTVERFYNGRNLLTEEHFYVNPDPDGVGPGLPTAPRVSRNVYDNLGHLRFFLSDEGRVTEFRYDADGNRTASIAYVESTYDIATHGSANVTNLAAWQSTIADVTAVLRTDNTYGLRGELLSSTTFENVDATGDGLTDGNESVTQFVYDLFGRLLQTTDGNGSTTTRTYDGLGRILTTTRSDATQTSNTTTTNVYADASNRTITTLANGLATTSIFNTAGQLITVINRDDHGNALGATRNYYDENGRLLLTRDPSGAQQFFMYDDAGRQIATVDGDGSLTQLVYNDNNQVIKTIQYFGRVSIAQLFDATGAPVDVPLASLITEASVNPAKDRITRAVYDTGNRLVFSIDEDGHVTENTYDGLSRVTAQTQYRFEVTIDRLVDELAPVDIVLTTSGRDRTARTFYDDDGLLIGTRDGGRFVTEFVYNAAGQIVEEIVYANASTSPNTVIFDDVRPTSDPANDLVSRFFYDGRGRRIGALDAEHYLTETAFDDNNNVTQVIRYDLIVSFTPGNTLDDIRPATLGASQISSFEYDEFNRVTREIDFQGTITDNSYDNVGNLVSSTRAVATQEVRSVEARFDFLGRVVGELTPEGTALLPGAQNQAEIDAIWVQYGIAHTYDLGGRRTSTTDQNGSTSYFYYYRDNGLRYIVNALGEVTETVRNALGQVIRNMTYADRVSIAGLTGGVILNDIDARVAAVADSARDVETVFTYTNTGRLLSTRTTDGGLTTTQYNAWGEVESLVRINDQTSAEITRFYYDERGLLTETRWDPPGISNQSFNTYDAFGRAITTTDRNGNVTSFEYDRLGRQITTTDPFNEARSATYDSFSRTLTTTDTLGNLTTFVYDDAARSVVVTTPEGVTLTTVQNRHGQIAQVTDALGNMTVSEYDVNGQLVRRIDNLGVHSEQDYDASGRLIETRDALGNRVNLSYDAANRVFARGVDIGGLALTTTFTYDGQGQTLLVTDPNGDEIANEYDPQGRLTARIVDPNGLAYRTEYAYTLRGDVLRITEGAGSANPRVVEYTYDILGRRTQEVVDPAGLAITTTFEYDDAGNVIRKVDANTNAVSFVYDAENRIRFTIDALNGVTETGYDSEGRLVATTRYATAIDSSGFGAILSVADVQAVLTTATTDRTEQSVYDDDGRAVYQINNNGGLTERTFDANGNVVRSMFYSEQITPASYATVAEVQAALALVADGDTTNDREERFVYDIRSRLNYSIDGQGGVVRSVYDAADKVVSTTAYAMPRAEVDLPDLLIMNAWIVSNADAAADRTTQVFYDAANRQVYTVDAEGFLRETQYDEVGRIVGQIIYVNAPTLPANATTQDIAAAIVVNTLRDQDTTTVYNAAGEVIQVIDASGLSESYTYDNVGNRLTLTNTKDDTWNYLYDANGRMIEERTPSVDIVTVGDVAGTLQSTTATEELLTRVTYDALGNVLSRTEAFGRPEARTTSYVYDELGRQVRTDFPAMDVYDAAGDSATLVGTAVIREELYQAIFSEVVYDTLGNAIRNQDIGGNYSHKVYDQLGRVQYEVDAERYVTEFRYDTFGNVTEFVRYANRLSSSGITDADLLSAADVSSRISVNAFQDRSINTTYDRLNQAVQVVQPAALSFEPTAGTSGGDTFSDGATALNTYNAFGQLVQQSQLVNPLTGAFADTYFYYDQRGQLTTQIGALGYLTSSEYDEFGNLQRQIEYSQALAEGTWDLNGFAAPTATTPGTSPNSPLGYDRETVFGYDRLNQLVQEGRVGVEFQQISGQTVVNGVAGQLTTYGYDAVGNQTRVTDANGADLYTYFDVLGRAIATAQPSRDPGDGSILIPISEMRRDAFGNLVEQRQYDSGATLATETAYTVVGAADRTTMLELNNYGNVIRTQDANGASRFASYNARGDVGKEWQYVTDNDGVVESIVSIYSYDRLGRQLSVVEPLTLPLDGSDTTPTVLINSSTAYNGFGEVVGHALNNQLSEFFTYDQAGRLWRTNAGDGADKVFLYNLAGLATMEIRSASQNLSSFASVQDVLDANQAQQKRTETRYDALGRIVEQRLPSVSTLTTSTSVRAIGGIAIGDVLTTNNPDATYRRVVTNGVVDFIISPYTPIESGGGYSFDGTNYNLDHNFQVVSSRYISFAAPEFNATDRLFEYRDVSDPLAPWITLNVEDLPNNRAGVDVETLDAGDYEFRLFYTRAGQTDNYGEASGDFTITGTTETGIALSKFPQDDAGQIPEISAGSQGGISAQVMSFNDVDDIGQNSEGEFTFFWKDAGDPGPNNINDVLVTFDSVEGQAFVEFDYWTMDITNESGATVYATSERRTMGLLVEDASRASAGERLQWRESRSGTGGGGITRVEAIRVYVRDENTGLYRLHQATDLEKNEGFVYWRAPLDTNVVADFRVRPAGTTAYTSLEVVRNAGQFMVDTSMLANGEWEYEVVYTRNSVVTASVIGMLDIDGGSYVVTGNSEILAENLAVSPVLGTVTADIDVSVPTFGASLVITNGPFGFSAELPPEQEWSGTNQIDLAWADLGSDPVRVVVDYETQRRNRFFYTNPISGGQFGIPDSSGWEPFAGVQATGEQASRTFEFSSGAASTGATLQWTDQPDADQGGLGRVQRVRVYTQNGAGVWVLQHDRDASARLGGTTLQWRAPSEPEDSVTARIRLVGDSVWQAVSAPYNRGWQVVDLDGFADGDYEYEIVHAYTYLDDLGATQTAEALATGIATIGDGLVQVTQTGQVYDPSTGDLGPIAADGDTLSWSFAPDAGATVIVRHKPEGAFGFIEQLITDPGPDYTVTLAGADKGIIDYEILYVRNGETIPYASATGSLIRNTSLIDFGADRIDLTQTATLITTSLPIHGISTIGDVVSWITAPEAGASAEFRYRQGVGAWTALPIVTTATGFEVDPTAMALGAYDFEINYVRSGETIPYAQTTGQFDLQRVTRGGIPTLNVTTSISPNFITQVPSINQMLDRWGAVIAVTDARGNTTDYRYNQFGQLLEVRQPEVDVVDTRSSLLTQRERPTTRNHYDLLGQLIGVEDANGNVNSATYNTASQIVTETHADGGVKSFEYDAYGNVTDTIDELGFGTRNTYDGVNQLSSTDRELAAGAIDAGLATNIINQSFVYDEGGRRISDTNGEAETTRFWYDLQGNIERRQTPRGFETTAVFDSFANKISETDANGNSMSWVYDNFSRLTRRFDLGGFRTDYTYNQDSQLTRERLLRNSFSTAHTRDYSYDVAGRVVQIRDLTSSNPLTIAEDTGLLKMNRVATYGYDIADNRTRESVLSDGEYHSDAAIQFDELGRISDVVDLRFDLEYDYDANGNRTHTVANYFNHQKISANQNLGYAYDNMNRVTLSQGVASGGTVTINQDQGVELTYDLAGQRQTARSYGQFYDEYETTIVIDGFPETITRYRILDGFSTETYAYDGAGRLSTVTKDDVVTTSRQHDRASREVFDTNRSIRDTGNGLETRVRTSAYDADGRTTQQTTTLNGQTESQVAFGDSVQVGSFWTRGYDDAGILRGYSVQVFDKGQAQYTTNYATEYRLGSGYQEVRQTANSFRSAGGDATVPTSGETLRDYNTREELVMFTDSKDANKNRAFRNNINGQAITVVQGQASAPVDAYTGSRFAIASADNESNEPSITRAIRTPDNLVKAQHYFYANDDFLGSFGQLLSEEGTFEANFDTNFTAVSKDYPPSVPGQVIAQRGETLRNIAARVFGDASLWYVLAEANGLANPDELLVEGSTITIPNEVLSLGNTATSFKPFDAAAALGDTSPTQPLPPPPKKKGCGVLGQILVIVVAIIVTVYTAGAAASALSGIQVTGTSVLSGAAASSGGVLTAATAAGGAGLSSAAAAGIAIGSSAIGGAVGSIASQGVAIAANLQDGFSWGNVALGAIGAGVTSGLGASGAVGNFVRDTGSPTAGRIFNAAANSAITQGVAVATGLQDSFSWSNIAISAVSAPITRYVGDRAGAAFNNDFVGGVASSLVGTAVRLAVGGKVDIATVIADAFGNAIGQEIVSRSSRPPPEPSALEIESFGEIGGEFDNIPSAEVLENTSLEDKFALFADILSDNLTIEPEELAVRIFGQKDPNTLELSGATSTPLGNRATNVEIQNFRSAKERGSVDIGEGINIGFRGLKEIFAEFGREAYEKEVTAIIQIVRDRSSDPLTKINLFTGLEGTLNDILKFEIIGSSGLVAIAGGVAKIGVAVADEIADAVDPLRRFISGPVARAFRTSKAFSDDLVSGAKAEARSILDTKPDDVLKERVALSKAGVADLRIQTKSFFNFPVSATNFPGVKLDGPAGTFTITNQRQFIARVEELFEESGSALQPIIKERLLELTSDATRQFPTTPGGIPGLHAEVRAVNDILRRRPDDFNLSNLNRIEVATFRLGVGSNAGKPFVACPNCEDLLRGVTILTN